jgi:hypothetical protein
MDNIALALIIIGCLACLSYCSVQEDKNRHELVMYCIQHGGHISNWNGGCEGAKP